MSDYENPGQSPQNPGVVEQPAKTQAALTNAMLLYLREAAPWLRFLGIMGFIGSGIVVLSGIICFFSSSAFEFLPDELSGIFDGAIGLIYLVVGALMFFPARFMYLFGAKIRDYQISGSTADLEQAFKNNKSLWKFSGILCIVYLACIPAVIVISVIAIASSLL